MALLRPPSNQMRMFTSPSRLRQPSSLAHLAPTHLTLTTKTSPTVQRRPHLILSHQWHQKPIILLQRSPPRRHASTIRDSARALMKSNPITFPFALFCTFLSLCGLVYVNYYYRNVIILPYLNYPEVVAAKLRRAAYYVNQDPNPQKALKYYQQALEVAREVGMDPYSMDIIGIKIDMGIVFQKAGLMDRAVEFMENVRGELEEWMKERGERGYGDGTRRVVLLGQKDEERGFGKAGARVLETEGMWRRKRTLLLKNLVRTDVHLGDLYADARVDRGEMAMERCVEGITIMLRERERREVEGVKEGEEEWFEDGEWGAALESLGDRYASKSQHYLSTPLYLQALPFSPPNSCHTIVLMNNLAASLALQNPTASSNSTSPTSSPPASQTNQLDAAAQWARKALELGKKIQGEHRTRECDEGCAVAAINLGDFCAMEGRVQEARGWWEQGREISRKIGFGEGRSRAEGALKGVEGK